MLGGYPLGCCPVLMRNRQSLWHEAVVGHLQKAPVVKLQQLHAPVTPNRMRHTAEGHISNRYQLQDDFSDLPPEIGPKDMAMSNKILSHVADLGCAVLVFVYAAPNPQADTNANPYHGANDDQGDHKLYQQPLHPRQVGHAMATPWLRLCQTRRLLFAKQSDAFRPWLQCAAITRTSLSDSCVRCGKALLGFEIPDRQMER